MRVGKVLAILMITGGFFGGSRCFAELPEPDIGPNVCMDVIKWERTEFRLGNLMYSTPSYYQYVVKPATYFDNGAKDTIDCCLPRTVYSDACVHYKVSSESELCPDSETTTNTKKTEDRSMVNDNSVSRDSIEVDKFGKYSWTGYTEGFVAGLGATRKRTCTQFRVSYPNVTFDNSHFWLGVDATDGDDVTQRGETVSITLNHDFYDAENEYTYTYTGPVSVTKTLDANLDEVDGSVKVKPSANTVNSQCYSQDYIRWDVVSTKTYQEFSIDGCYPYTTTEAEFKNNKRKFTVVRVDVVAKEKAAGSDDWVDVSEDEEEEPGAFVATTSNGLYPVVIGVSPTTDDYPSYDKTISLAMAGGQFYSKNELLDENKISTIETGATVYFHVDNPGEYEITATHGASGAVDKAKVTVVKLDVIEMDFKDSKNANGTVLDNNFDIVDDYGELIVPDCGPEWVCDSGEVGEAVYVKGSKVCADVKFKATPIVSNKTIEMLLYSEGDLDFTHLGDSNRMVTLFFDSAGFATKEFSSYAKVASSVLERKDYSVNWKGAATGNEIKQNIYTLYGPPVDNWNGTAVVSCPSHQHLRFLLGPKVIGEGEWCTSKSTLNESVLEDSVPFSVQKGIIADGSFCGSGASCLNPWNVVISDAGGVCEDWAELMKQALLVAGVPEEKIDRKSVVTSPVSRSSWLGGGSRNVIGVFREEPGGEMWMNEGVCGVKTDDKGWRYYDLAASGQKGKGGWADPTDASDNNLWYEPSSSGVGPIMHEIVPEFYGTWVPQSTAPYEASANKNAYISQILITSVTKNDTSYTVSYRTEGAKYYGVKVCVTLFCWQAGAWAEVQEKQLTIAEKWDNSQSIVFDILQAGNYTVTARIVDENGKTEYGTVWRDNSWKYFTYP